MPDWSTLSLFVAAAAVLVFMPGPNTLYVVARSINQGLAAGIVSSLGVQIGTLFHVAAAAFGISALLLASAWAFNAVKYAGAVYLIYLGVKTLLAKEKVEVSEKIEKNSLRRIFTQGIVVNLLNPKTAVFFFAFLPQFVDESRGAVAIQIILLGLILIILGAASDSIYALTAGAVNRWMRGSGKFLRFQRYFAGTVYIGFGATTAFAPGGAPPK